MSTNFTAADVQELRRATGAGMMDAKDALSVCNGDQKQAMQMLRETGVAKSAARADRDNHEGVVVAGIDGQVGAIVELRCETDFVAKSEDVSIIANDLLKAVLSNELEAASSKRADIENIKITHQENIEIGRIERYEAGEGELLDVYVHQQSGRGVNAVMVHIENPGKDKNVAHDIALHIASNRPKYLSRDDIPSEEVDRERSTLEAMSRNEGKPEAALAKIVEGRMNGFYRENALLDQKFVKDEKISIVKLLGDSTIKRFTQIEVGA